MKSSSPNVFKSRIIGSLEMPLWALLVSTVDFGRRRGSLLGARESDVWGRDRFGMATTGRDPVFNWEVDWVAPIIFVFFAILPFSEKLRGCTLEGAKVAVLGGVSLGTWAEFLFGILKLGCEDRARRWDMPLAFWKVLGFSELLACRRANSKGSSDSAQGVRPFYPEKGNVLTYGW